MTESTAKRATHKAPLTPRHRQVVIGIVLALLVFLVIVIFDTFQRFPQIWLYIVLLDLHFQLSRLGLIVAGGMATLAAYIGHPPQKGCHAAISCCHLHRRRHDAASVTHRRVDVLLKGAVPKKMSITYTGMASVLALPFFIFVEGHGQETSGDGQLYLGVYPAGRGAHPQYHDGALSHLASRFCNLLRIVCQTATFSLS